MGDGDVPIGVGKTALGVAMVSAEESRRSDRLFDDPYAAPFRAAAPGVFDREQRAVTAGIGAMAGRGAVFWSPAVIRNRLFDDYLLDAAGQSIGQVAPHETPSYDLVRACGMVLSCPDVASATR
jgi:O-methyltransferase involved in polyketide biosynthesis